MVNSKSKPGVVLKKSTWTPHFSSQFLSILYCYTQCKPTITYETDINTPMYCTVQDIYIQCTYHMHKIIHYSKKGLFQLAAVNQMAYSYLSLSKKNSHYTHTNVLRMDINNQTYTKIHSGCQQTSHHPNLYEPSFPSPNVTWMYVT